MNMKIGKSQFKEKSGLQTNRRHLCEIVLFRGICCSEVKCEKIV